MKTFLGLLALGLAVALAFMWEQLTTERRTAAEMSRVCARQAQELAACSAKVTAQESKLQEQERDLRGKDARTKELESRRDSIQRLRVVVAFEETGTPPPADAPKSILLGRARLVGAEEIVLVTSQSTTNPDSQVEGKKLVVIYEPRDLDGLVGKSLAVLASTRFLVVESIRVLRKSGLSLSSPETKVSITVELNGVNVVQAASALPADFTDAAHLEVAADFEKIPAAYAAAIPAAN